jgi:DNA-binding transcriptional LysR family regulator
VELRVAEGHTGPLLTTVRAGELDFAYVGLGPGERIPAGLSSEVVAAEPVVLAVHPTHPLAGRESVPLSRLRDQPMVMLPEGSGQRTMVESAARAAGFTPRVIAESGQLGLLTELAAHGVGAALVPRSAARESPGLAVIRISRPALTPSPGTDVAPGGPGAGRPGISRCRCGADIVGGAVPRPG